MANQLSAILAALPPEVAAAVEAGVIETLVSTGIISDSRKDTRQMELPFYEGCGGHIEQDVGG